jgi:hypothetical protein
VVFGNTDASGPVSLLLQLPGGLRLAEASGMIAKLLQESPKQIFISP